MSNAARRYFNTYKCKREPKYLKLFGYLFSFNWADNCWTTISDREMELTHFFRFGKTRNMREQTMYELNIWRLLIIWGR